MSSERRIEVEVEVPVAPEQAWEAIATGPGISAWFMPAEVEERVGGRVVHDHGADLPTTATVTGYEPPRRFAYEERGWAPAGEDPSRPIATEFLVEARSGGTCAVRVVMSGFGDSEAWEHAMESFRGGWNQALGALRLYLTHFPGESASSINAGGMVSGGKDEVWSEIIGALGLPAEPESGERVATTAPDAPSLAGTVQEAAGPMLTLILDQPARGLAFVGCGGPGDEVYVFVRAQLFGPDATEVAAREQEAWKSWFAGRLAGAAPA
jgi:uncharacterized protein YndB with AHSA1/START domain